MKFKFKILLYSENHITGNLVFLKLKAYGHKVFLVEESVKALNLLDNERVDLLVVDGLDTSISSFQVKITEQKLPTLFIDKKNSPSLNLNRVSLKLAFKEEDFLHKVSYVTEYNNAENSLSLLESVVQHYSGDLELAQKVILSFIGSWQSSIGDIEKSFGLDDDKVLAAKIHSFKGVLSALGDTEAAALVKKMEILVKGRSRKVAHEMFGQLHVTCRNLVEELETSSLMN